MYQKAAILSMMSEEEVKRTGEDIVELFRSAQISESITVEAFNKLPLCLLNI